MENTLVERTVWIDAPVQRAWRAVTDPKQLEMWYAPGSPWEIPVLDVGRRVTFYLTPNVYNTNTETVTLFATIDVVDEPYRFALRWDADLDFPKTAMVMIFTLTEENGGTRVTLSATGVDAPEPVSNTPDGWSMSMQNLKAYSEGRSLPF